MRSVYEIGSAAAARVCINAVSEHDASGQLFTSFKSEGTEFHGLLALCSLLDNWFDCYNYPQNTHAHRTFSKGHKQVVSVKKAGEKISMNEHQTRGDKATFVVSVKFRQNASWQGTIQWVDTQKTQQFRSALELIKLIDSAVREEDEPEICWEN